MNKTLLVSLVSNETIPNVQMIKQLLKTANKYLFISTKKMEDSGQRAWIIKANNIAPENLLEPIIIDPYSFEDIEEKLDAIDFQVFDKVYVNLTGGTKVMTLAAYEYFKEVGAEIYYVTGKENDLIKLSPGRRKKIEKLNIDITLNEYLTAYGFEIQETKGSEVPADYTNHFFELYTSANSELPNHPMISLLREKFRDKGTIILNIEGLDEFLNQIDFPVKDEKLTKYEVKYLTGEWFEEWMQNRLITENTIYQNEVKSGVILKKKSYQGKDVQNEMDVLFIHSNKLFTIECKTSVFNNNLPKPTALKSPLEKGATTTDPAKQSSIIGEVIYKSDSLQRSLGLFANTNIFLLNSKEEKNVISESQKNRAELSRIKIFYLEDLIQCDSISKLLGLSK